VRFQERSPGNGGRCCDGARVCEPPSLRWLFGPGDPESGKICNRIALLSARCCSSPRRALLPTDGVPVWRARRHVGGADIESSDRAGCRRLRLRLRRALNGLEKNRPQSPQATVLHSPQNKWTDGEEGAALPPGSGRPPSLAHQRHLLLIPSIVRSSSSHAVLLRLYAPLDQRDAARPCGSSSIRALFL
jgi:hypothetical protein